MSSKILVLPGDGIGVEVADQAIRAVSYTHLTLPTNGCV